MLLLSGIIQLSMGNTMFKKNLVLGIIVTFSSLHVGAVSASSINVIADSTSMDASEILSAALNLNDLDKAKSRKHLVKAKSRKHLVKAKSRKQLVKAKSRSPAAFDTILELIESNSGRLTSQQFEPKVAGVWLSDPLRLDLANDLGSSLSGSVAISAVLGPTAVPVPATIWLFGAGLVGLLGIWKRQACA
jgi:hypothetical protein